MALLTLEVFWGDRELLLKDVLKAVNPLMASPQCSSIYEISRTSFERPGPRIPVPSTQEWGALVMAVAGRPKLELPEFFERLQGIEEVLNSQDRHVDVDLVFFKDVVMLTPALTLPHPEFHRRPYLVVPAAEIMPNQIHPILGKTLTQMSEPFLGLNWGRYFAQGSKALES